MIKNIQSKQDIVYILENLRKEDKEELIALHGKHWKEKILSDLEGQTILCLYFLTEKNEEIPLAMGGFFEQFLEEPSIACVWLLSTNIVKQYKKFFMKELSKEIDKASKKYSIMYNFIYKSNYEAKKWLRIFGFRFDNPYPKNIDMKDGFEFFYKTK